MNLHTKDCSTLLYLHSSRAGVKRGVDRQDRQEMWSVLVKINILYMQRHFQRQQSSDQTMKKCLYKTIYFIQLFLDFFL